MKAHILFAILTAAFFLAVSKGPASEEPEGRPLFANAAPMPLAILSGWPPVVRAEVEFESDSPSDPAGDDRLLRDLPPSEFIRGWVEEAGATHVQRENVTILAMPEYAGYLDREVDWQVRRIGTLSGIMDDARQSLQRSFDELYFRPFSTPLTQGWNYVAGMAVEDLTVYAWDEEIRTFEDFLFWILYRHPHMRLRVIFAREEDWAVGGSEASEMVREATNGEHRLVVGVVLGESMYANRPWFGSSEFYSLANADLFPKMDGDAIIERLATSGDPAMFERLVGSLTWIDEGQRGERRLPDGLSPEARRIASKANMLANMRIGDPILPPLSEISHDPRDPLDLLVMARIAAWRGDAETLAFSRAVLQHTGTLEGDWKRYFSETLRIYELRTKPEVLPLAGTSLHRGGAVRPRR